MKYAEGEQGWMAKRCDNGLATISFASSCYENVQVCLKYFTLSSPFSVFIFRSDV